MINFYNGQHAYYCGVDLHKKTMYVYVLNRDGETVFHKNLRTETIPVRRADAARPLRPGVGERPEECLVQPAANWHVRL